MPTITELGQAVKKKYPGEYDHVPDGELGNRIKLKYPEGYTEYTDAPPRRNEFAQKPSGPAIQTEEEKTNPNTVAFREFVGKPAVEALPILGATFGNIPGAGIGASLKQAAKSGAPSLFGQSENPVSEAASDVTVNSLIPSFLTKAAGSISKLFSGEGPTVRAAIASKIYKMTGNPSIGDAIAKSESAAGSRKFIYPKSQVVDTLAENTDNTLSVSDNVTDLLNAYKTGAKTESEVQKEILGSVNNVRQANLKDPTATRYLANDDLLSKHYKGSTGTFNAETALNDLKGPKNEIYKEAMGKDGYKSVETFLTDLQKTESPAKTGLKALNYVGNRFTLGLGGIGFGLLTGGVTGAAAVAGGAGTIILGNKALKMLVDNPEVAKLASQMLKTPASDPLSPMLKQIFMNSIRGAEVTVKLADDREQKAIVGPNGELQSPVPMR